MVWFESRLVEQISGYTFLISYGPLPVTLIKDTILYRTIENHVHHMKYLQLYRGLQPWLRQMQPSLKIVIQISVQSRTYVSYNRR